MQKTRHQRLRQKKEQQPQVDVEAEMRRNKAQIRAAQPPTKHVGRPVMARSVKPAKKKHTQKETQKVEEDPDMEFFVD